MIGNCPSSLAITLSIGLLISRFLPHVTKAAGAAGLILTRGTHVTNESAVQVELIVKVTVFNRKFPKLDVAVSPNKLHKNLGLDFWSLLFELLLNLGWMSAYLFSSGIYEDSVLDFVPPL